MQNGLTGCCLNGMKKTVRKKSDGLRATGDQHFGSGRIGRRSVVFGRLVDHVAGFGFVFRYDLRRTIQLTSTRDPFAQTSKRTKQDQSPLCTNGWFAGGDADAGGEVVDAGARR